MLYYTLSARFVLAYEENAYQNCMMHYIYYTVHNKS